MNGTTFLLWHYHGRYQAKESHILKQEWKLEVYEVLNSFYQKLSSLKRLPCCTEYLDFQASVLS